jgi:ribonucleoside-diphosphate reductase alpha chain
MISFQKWCEHNPSVTIKVGEDEWLAVANFVYNNFDDIAGISFLPKDDSVYQQAPFQEIDEETYNKWVDNFPKIDWDLFPSYERGDQTKSANEFACVSGDCTVTEI